MPDGVKKAISFELWAMSFVNVWDEKKSTKSDLLISKIDFGVWIGK